MKTISHCQGKGKLSHNNRKFAAQNVDSSRSADNIVFVQMPIQQAYEVCFGAAVARYNARQKRSDRKIKDGYFQYIFNQKPRDTVVTAADKRKSFYESLVQIGDKNDTGVGTIDAEIASECLKEYMMGFAERNPNFFVFNAVLHVDEATPHLHIDHIPIAHCKRGLDTQNGMAQALKEMGFGEGKDAISRWRGAERKVLEEICARHGIEISAPQKARGYSFTVPEYKQIKEEIKAAKKELNCAKGELKATQEKVNKLLNYIPPKTSEDLSDHCHEIIKKIDDIKLPLIQKSTAQEALKAMSKQAKIAIGELGKAEQTIYALGQANTDFQKTNKKIENENENLRTENSNLRQELSAARKLENAIQRLGLSNVVSAEVDRQAEEEKSRQKQKKQPRQGDLSF